MQPSHDQSRDGQDHDQQQGYPRSFECAGYGTGP
jgi:hypothetical protein